MEGAGMSSRHSGSDLPTRDSEVMPKVYIRAAARAHVHCSQQSLSKTLLFIDTLQS
jgi:hypothetical protein